MKYELDDVKRIIDYCLGDYHKQIVNDYIDSLLNEIVICNDHIHRLLLNEEKALKFINDVWKSTNINTNTVVSLRVIEGILKGESNEE